VFPELAGPLAFAVLAAAGFFLGMPSSSLVCERPQRKTVMQTEAAIMKIAMSHGGMIADTAADAPLADTRSSLTMADGATVSDQNEVCVYCVLYYVAKLSGSHFLQQPKRIYIGI
jgi:hypothetical protein